MPRGSGRNAERHSDTNSRLLFYLGIAVESKPLPGAHRQCPGIGGHLAFRRSEHWPIATESALVQFGKNIGAMTISYDDLPR
jgi:hypothetical protein